MAKTIYVLNVPKLDQFGNRGPEALGQGTLSDVERVCAETARYYGLRAACRQPGGEDELIDFIHQARASKAAGIIVNADCGSRRSPALDAVLTAVQIPAIELQTGAGENVRQHSLVAKAAVATLCGFGIDGYRLAISGLAAKIGAKAAA